MSPFQVLQCSRYSGIFFYRREDLVSQGGNT